MRFIASVPVTAVVDADPVGAPEDVLDSKLVGHGGEGPLSCYGATQRLLLSFLGGAGGETATMEVWALDSDTLGGDPEDRRFYLVKAATLLTHQVLTEVALTVPAHGPFYFRQTAGADVGVIQVAVQAG